jgi:hypothetical protein
MSLTFRVGQSIVNMNLAKFSEVHLIDLDRAVELRKLLLEELEVGVDEAQLQRHRLLQLLVRRRPAHQQHPGLVFIHFT